MNMNIIFEIRMIYVLKTTRKFLFRTGTSTVDQLIELVILRQSSKRYKIHIFLKYSRSYKKNCVKTLSKKWFIKKIL